MCGFGLYPHFHLEPLTPLEFPAMRAIKVSVTLTRGLWEGTRVQGPVPGEISVPPPTSREGRKLEVGLDKLPAVDDFVDDTSVTKPP